MKKSVIKGMVAIMLLIGLASCSDCKQCSVSAFGTQVGESQKLCGEDLKKAEAAGMNCK